VHEVLGIGDDTVRLVSSAITQLVDHKLGLIDADGHQRKRSPITEVKRRQHVPDCNGMERGGDKDGPRSLDGVLPHGVLRGEVVGVDARKGTVVADGAGEHVGNPIAHQRVHDPALDQPGLHRSLDGPCRADPVDGAHMQPMAALSGLASVAHSQGGPKDRRLDIVHGDGVAGQHRLYVAVPNEPLEIGPGPRVHQRRSGHPDQITAPPFLLPNSRGQLLIIDRALSADFCCHEAKFVDSVAASQKTLSVNHDAFGAVLRLTHGNQLASLEPPRFDGLQPRTAFHYHAIHSGARGSEPVPIDPDIRRQVGGREKAFRQDAVSRERCEPRLRCAGERRLTKIGHCSGSRRRVHTPVKVEGHTRVFKRVSPNGGV
jgi:hypothetical protein